MKKTVFIILLIFACSKISMAQKESRFQAMFIYNFTKYISYPKSKQIGDFTIGVLGSSRIINAELERIAKVKKVGSQKIILKKFASINDIIECHILYIPVKRTKDLEEVLKLLKGKATLIVTGKKDLTSKGASISFSMKGKRLSFQICKKNIKKQNLKVLSALLTLGNKKC
ncbi:MAG: hypothetical protein B6I24_09890 [Bacteroidetes bacterium 4572_128]|nr:MAG: hypothetical protein B6I24_09890 [Bacteroidetes bacterium 4572_128]